MSSSKNFLVGIFDDEESLFGAIKNAKEKGMKIHEVYTPYPVHGLEHTLGYKTNLSVVAFFFGITGTTLAFIMMYYMLGYDWPMIIGGKNFTPLPDFIPIAFEMTVLFAAFGMVGTFLVSNNLKPWGKPVTFDERSTDDKLVMAIDLEKNTLSPDQITSILSDSGASEVNSKSFD